MKLLQRLVRPIYIILLLLTLCSVTTMQADELRRHTVRPGDTYYSLARYYQVTVDALMAANPEAGRTLVCGTTLIIPDAQSDVKTDSAVAATTAVAPKVPVQNNPVTSVDKQPEVTTTPEPAVTTSTGETTVWTHLSNADYRIALVLPLKLTQISTSDKQRARNVEFYQGFLMALDSLQKSTRHTFEVSVYDASDGLTSVLGSDAFAKNDLIFSTVDKTEAQQLAAYAEQRNIPLVLPFVYEQTWHNRYPHTYQVNTPKAQTYDILTDEVLRRFDGYTPVFLVDSTELNKVDDYTVRLRQELTRHGRNYFTFGYSDPAMVGSIDSMMPRTEKVLYVPVTASRNALRRMFPYMQYLRTRYADDSFAVLGTPEWQLYTDDFIEYFYTLDVYIYSKIYVNPFADDVRSFYAAFKRWYGCDPMPLYPKYALTGYDLGMYFLTALTHTGRQFGAGIGASSVNTLQSAINLHSEGKGYINRGVYLIHFTPQTTIEKYDLH